MLSFKTSSNATSMQGANEAAPAATETLWNADGGGVSWKRSLHPMPKQSSMVVSTRIYR